MSGLSRRRKCPLTRSRKIPGAMQSYIGLFLYLMYISRCLICFAVSGGLCTILHFLSRCMAVCALSRPEFKTSSACIQPVICFANGTNVMKNLGNLGAVSESFKNLYTNNPLIGKGSALWSLANWPQLTGGFARPCRLLVVLISIVSFMDSLRLCCRKSIKASPGLDLAMLHDPGSSKTSTVHFSYAAFLSKPICCSKEVSSVCSIGERPASVGLLRFL